MAHLGRAHGRHAVRQLVRLLQLDKRIEIDSDNIAVGEPARNMGCVCVWEGCFVGNPCRVRLGQAVRARALHVPCMALEDLPYSPAAPGASSSDMRTLPTMSTLFCNQRKPVIDP